MSSSEDVKVLDEKNDAVQYIPNASLTNNSSSVLSHGKKGE